MTEPDYEVVFVGGGFRTLTYLASAPWLFQHRIAIVEERSEVGGGDFSGYHTMSTSIARRFFAHVHPDVIPDLAETPGLASLMASDEPVLLHLLATQLDVAGRIIVDRFSPASTVMHERVTEVAISDRNAPLIRLQSGASLRARHVVLATGRHELPHPELSLWRERVMVSSTVLNPDSHSCFRRRLMHRPRHPVVIVGGSHSAMSVLSTILKIREADGALFRGRSIVLLQRSPVKLFARSWECSMRLQRLDWESVPTLDDVCPETGHVFRDSGLRGSSKSLYLAVQGQSIAGVEVRRIRHIGEAGELLSAAALIIQATGYVGRTPTLTGGDGRVLRHPGSPNRLPVTPSGAVIWDDAPRVDFSAIRVDPTPPELRDHAAYGQRLYADLSFRLSKELSKGEGRG